MRSRTCACLLRGSICRKQEKQLKQKAACWRRKSEERTEDGGRVRLRAFLFLGASLFLLYSICIVLQLAARVGRERLNQKKSGDGEAQEGIPGHKRFTSSRPQPVFQARTIHGGEEKIWSEIGRARWGRRGGGGAWMTYYREIYTLRNKAGEFQRNRINSASWEALLGSSCDHLTKVPPGTLSDGFTLNTPSLEIPVRSFHLSGAPAGTHLQGFISSRTNTNSPKFLLTLKVPSRISTEGSPWNTTYSISLYREPLWRYFPSESWTLEWY